MSYSDELYHHGIKGQKWGVRRFRNRDGSLTDEGKARYSNPDPIKNKNKFLKGKVSKLASVYTDIDHRAGDEEDSIRKKYAKQYAKLEKLAYSHQSASDEDYDEVYEKYWEPLEDLEYKIDQEVDKAWYKYGKERKQATIDFIDEMKSVYGDFKIDDLDVNSGVLGKPGTYGDDADHPGETYSDYDYIPYAIQSFLYDSKTHKYDSRYWNLLGAKDEEDYYKKMGW